MSVSEIYSVAKSKQQCNLCNVILLLCVWSYSNDNHRCNIINMVTINISVRMLTEPMQ